VPAAWLSISQHNAPIAHEQLASAGDDALVKPSRRHCSNPPEVTSSTDRAADCAGVRVAGETRTGSGSHSTRQRRNQGSSATRHAAGGCRLDRSRSGARRAGVASRGERADARAKQAYAMRDDRMAKAAPYAFARAIGRTSPAATAAATCADDGCIGRCGGSRGRVQDMIVSAQRRAQDNEAMAGNSS